MQDSIIILRSDAIGDYLLFRNFLSELKISYPTYHITLCGNLAYKELATTLDSEFVDTFIWIDIKRMKNTMYRICTLRKLKTTAYDIFINPLHSRDSINILLSTAIYAREKVAPQGDSVNVSAKEKAKNDRIYSQLTPSKAGIMFEFYRNREFFEYFLGRSLEILPSINHNLLPPIEHFNLPKDYSVLFIGASMAYRKWSVEHFAKVALHLIECYHQHIVICSGKEDSELANNLIQIIESKKHNDRQIINLVGKTSLTQLGEVVYNGNLLVSNETSCVHLASILDTTIVIVVSNGNHLGRFIPYPKEICDKYYPVFHRFIEDNLDKYEELSNKFAYKSTLDINEITPDKVIGVIDKIHNKFQQKEQ